MRNRSGRNLRIFTIPNALSVLRIVLIAVFCFLFDPRGTVADNWPAFIVLALNALSDFLDGKLARALNQVSEVGKLLDPIADYLTKFALLLCVLTKHPPLIGFLLLFLCRVFIVAVAAFITVRRVGKNEGAIFIGKLDTVVFYAVMLSLVLYPNMPDPAALALLLVSALIMVLTIVLYLRYYAALRRGGALPQNP